MPEVVEVVEEETADLEEVVEATEQVEGVEAMVFNRLHRNVRHPLSISSSKGFQVAKAE